MKRTLWSLLACGTLAASLSFAQTPAETSTPETPAAPKKEKVTKMDGQSFFGIVTLTDDYTLKISNDSGIMKIPLAVLGESDFKKFGLQKDRSKDGRLWSERKDALEEQKKADEAGDGEKSASNDNSAIEIQLGEIAVFQPIISAFEMTQTGKKKHEGDKAEASDAESENKAQGAEEPGRKLFSGPGNIGNFVPFSGPGSSFAQPVMSVGGSAVQSAAGLTPSLPGVPGVPGAP